MGKNEFGSTSVFTLAFSHIPSLFHLSSSFHTTWNQDDWGTTFRTSGSPNRIVTGLIHMKRTTLFITGQDFIHALIRDSMDDDDDSDDTHQKNRDRKKRSKYTHMIAIPMETNHDLMIELESVQRAVLYHCPLLIQSCIVPALTRMPLLFVNTQEQKWPRQGHNMTRTILDEYNNPARHHFPEATETPDSDLLTSRDPKTRALHKIVQEVIRDLVNVVSTDFPHKTQEEQNQRCLFPARNGLNPFSIQPILIPFQNLEVDGEENDVLYAIGKEGEGTNLLRRVIMRIAERIENELGWEVDFPPDQQIPEKKDENMHIHTSSRNHWRPRIPFMRLPTDFKETLPPPKGLDGDWDLYTKEEKMNYVRFPEEGGNGISPIFWYQWWEDVFCNGHGIRMKEIAVYGRTGPFGIAETAFYIPHLRTVLPHGNEELTRDEAKAEAYVASRSLESNGFDEEQYKSRGPRDMVPLDEADLAFRRIQSEAKRNIIEKIYSSSPEASEKVDIKERIENLNYEEERAKTRAFMEDFSIREESAMKPSVTEIVGQGNRVGNVTKKNKPKPEDNPIFQQWKERKTMAYDTPFQSERSDFFSPFPSDEYFVGLWCFISSPLGLRLNGSLKDPNGSETLILRVDGSISGGPVLNEETGQKAAGGSWRMFAAEWIGGSQNNMDSDKNIQTRLRIRLIVPPKKDRAIVMEGEVIRMCSSASSLSNAQASTSTGKTQYKCLDDKIYSNVSSEYRALQCKGDMWIEDIDSNRSTRKKLGSFLLTKLKDPDPSQLRYTVPSGNW